MSLIASKDEFFVIPSFLKKQKAFKVQSPASAPRPGSAVWVPRDQRRGVGQTVPAPDASLLPSHAPWMHFKD